MKMSFKSRQELVKKAKSRYLKSDKIEKMKILDELCENTELNRKYLIQILSPKFDLSEKVRIKKRKQEIYDGYVIGKLKEIWEVFDYPCGQNLVVMLPEYIKVLEKVKEISFTERIKEKLLKISSAKTSSWDEKRLGYGELDTVAHCGNSAKGDFVNSLTFTDILTGWTESIAFMGKSQIRVKEGLENIEKRLPFQLKGIDPDNGSEFINWQMYRSCLEKNIEFTRGRPYHKNDNAHIEQKNWTHVRKLIGYQRLETEKELEILNSLYLNEWRLYKNFFIPNKKLIEKKRLGSKIVKKYDKPKTPFIRILESDLPENEKKLNKFN